jgi:hypothetical protein
VINLTETDSVIRKEFSDAYFVTNYSHTVKKNDNFRQQIMIKESPSEAKE